MSTISCCAQLNISPSAIADHYIFVNNQVLYVQNEIHLEKNRNPSTEASIYLRNEAQLLQGEKEQNINKGNGLISLFQEGTSNAYDYNYWSLPVQNPGTSKNLNEIIFEPQDLTKSNKANLTAELDGTAEPLTISKRWIYSFSGDDYNDWKNIGDQFVLKPGEGFTMKGTNGVNRTVIYGVENNPGSEQRYDFRGIPNDGAYSIKILENQSLLVGNPYPSSLHLKNFLLNNPATTGIAYFWDSKENGKSHYLKDYEGGYGAYSPGANSYVPAIFKKYRGNGEIVNVTGENGAIIPREFIPVAQGFMLVGSEDGFVGFRNTYRIFKTEKSGISQFKAAYKNNNDEVIPNLRLNVEINNLYLRPLLLAFREDATTGKDWAMDAMVMNGIASDAGWLIDEDHYIINVRPYVPEEKIPLIVNMASEGEIIFSLQSLIALNPEKVVIYDAERNTYHNIKEENQRIVLSKGKFSERFFLIIEMPAIQEKEDPATPTEEIPAIPETSIFISPEEVQVLQNNKENVLQLKIPAKLQAQHINLFDIKGSKILSQTIPESEKAPTISTEGLSEGVYILNILSKGQKKISKKITIKKG
ncbi:T9SS type A sorting domain-containing protein [Autumnicola musiva]|uniref:T9SS type A sorting domain-containing protein n=1 Tax=Autumnicola musiva TaxID=3075589 RepID=A0ABU3D454_9FLAO|nr:T9SS type A sorting domain-containing protein [Zunongwangia sp. F117]MDT0676319.1 T9SS type A sorting domain-containing protein [Zunongwangia sp. F117]